jgi:heat shock protein HslJ
VVLASGCADADPPAGDPATGLIGVTWILEAASVEALIDEVVPPHVRLTIRFEGDGAAGGSAGCNSFGGSYMTGPDLAMSIDAGGMTQMACDEPLMRLDSAYVEALGDVVSFKLIDDGAGLLLSGAETPLSYVAEQPVPLEGTAWAVDAIAIGGDAVASTIAEADATLTFEAGAVTGTTGCNRLTGSYSSRGDASGGEIGFSGIATTKKACAPDVADQQQTILAALDAAASYSIEGPAMSLRDAQGAFLLSLVAS